MEFTKLEHSGCVVECNGKKVVFDPVEFTMKLPELENVVAVMITHKHGDHLQMENLERLLVKNPQARILTTADAASQIPGAEIVKNGDVVNIDSFELKFFGEDHAAIVPGQVPCQNLGVVVNDKIVNPGDSYDAPASPRNPELLLVPSVAPWSKLDEAMQYIRAVQPKMVVPVHDALLSDVGNGFYNNWLKRVCEEVGARFLPLMVGESIEV